MSGWMQIALYLAVLLLCAKPLGLYMAKVLEGEPTFLTKILRPLERLIYRLGGVKSEEKQDWKRYAVGVVIFNALGFLFVFLLQRFQASLPLNPAGMGAVSADSAFNTASSFSTNTNWQGYGGESTMSYLTQMLALGVQNFVSAATGIAVLAALIRGLRAREATHIGNFWVDLTRSTLYILLPLSILLSVGLVSQGVVQTFNPSAKAELVQPTKDTKEQTIALGPAASQIAIKQLGTNGGGFFNVNSSHPLENPTPVSNFLESLAILLIPAGLCITFGQMLKDRRQGWAVLAAMTVLLLMFLVPCVLSEQAGNPMFKQLGLTTAANWEGKETRFGIENSALWATATTAASNGSVNSMHDSYTPLGGLMPMILMQLGEVVFGGVGSGLYGMLIFAVVAVFVAGLMVGRTPEYVGKKIEAFEMKMASLVILIPCSLALLGTAIPLMFGTGQSSMSNPGAHGFSQLLYAYSSMANNNGSAFAGFGANVPFHNLLGGLIMWVSRFWLIVPVLAIAGSLAKKKIVPSGPGTLPTHTPLFVGLLCAIVLIVGALTFIPALALGPIAEHLRMAR
ncbi:MAG: potassium-transporting ATPase subunit KdpA [Armatimonadetes bacterium 55-13]|nr:potassium-transporting ATPase subunit KdpA [Armatimonadota bacterium]ODU54010.1 MAG: potassium-transporting ATPase subunit KdpA [bacterium SCN 57-13]OJU63429.1 MAG: potassium-transporting ATPase subunit KdpA [Armatimonadetes bacterium 55-13]